MKDIELTKIADQLLNEHFKSVAEENTNRELNSAKKQPIDNTGVKKN